MTRQRSPYASSAEVRRVARLAAELGIVPAALRLGADGSVLIAANTPAASATSDQSDEALSKWEQERQLVR